MITTNKTYEQDRDEECINTLNNCGIDEFSFKNGADWANDRAEKVIAEKDSDVAALKKQCDHFVSAGAALSEKLASRDAMIEKMKECLTGISTGSIYFEGPRGRTPKKMAQKVIAELEEWKKKK